MSAVVVVAVGQLGRIPVPPRYRGHEHEMYLRAIRAARTEAHRADVIVLGNSRVMFSIDAQELGRDLRLPGLRGGNARVANLAAPAMTPAGSLWMWRTVTSGSPRRRHPRVALIGVAPVDFTRRTPGNDYVLRYLYHMRDVLWLAEQGRMNDAATLLTYRLYPLYALHQSEVNLLLRRPRKEPPLPPPSRASDALWLLAHEGWYRDYRIEAWQVQCLRHMVADMRTRGVHVILFSPPVKASLLRIEAGFSPGAPMIGPNASEDRPGSPLRLFRSLMSNSFQRRPGMVYLDYMHAQDAKGLEFWDPTHLLPPSAVTFSRTFAADVNRVLAGAAPSHGSRVQEKGPAARY